MITDLRELAKGEGQQVEWKENVADVAKLIETVVAFANDISNLGGGYIVCGAKEIKDEFGFPTVDYVGMGAKRLEEVKKEVLNTCYNPTIVSPPLVLEVQELPVPSDASKRILIITVNATGSAHTYKNKREKDKGTIPRYYVRVDESTRQATNGLKRQLLIQKKQLESWDKRVHAEAEVEAIDELVLRQYLRDMGLWRNDKLIDQYLSDREVIDVFVPPLLGRLKMSEVLRPKNFAVLVFGKTPMRWVPGAYCILSVFEGETKGRPRGKAQWIQGTIVEQTKRIIELLEVEAITAIDKTDAENANQIKYPTLALKEAIVNAIVHRDYEIEQPVRVDVYSNRIEIYSPGGLPFNVRVEQFKEGKASASWRNQSLGRLFSELNLAQHRGSGVATIIDEMKREGNPAPDFQVDDFSVTCILPAHPRHRFMKLFPEIEQDIVIRDYKSALQKLYGILDEEVHNYKALELLGEVHRLQDTLDLLYTYLAKQQLRYDLIRPATLIIIAEMLKTLENNDGAQQMANELLATAQQSNLDEQAIQRIAILLRQLNKHKEVVSFVTEHIQKYPTLRNNNQLLQQRARAAMSLAMECETTAKQKKVSASIKKRAKEQFYHYIKIAEKDLGSALQTVSNDYERDWIRRDQMHLETIQNNLSASEQSKVFIPKVPKDIDRTVLRTLLSKYGVVESVTVKKPQRGYGLFAIVAFQEQAAAAAAIKAYKEKSDPELMEKRIEIKQYKPPSR